MRSNWHHRLWGGPKLHSQNQNHLKQNNNGNKRNTKDINTIMCKHKPTEQSTQTTTIASNPHELKEEEAAAAAATMPTPTPTPKNDNETGTKEEGEEEETIFEDDEDEPQSTKKPELFLGFFRKKYVKSMVGATHGIASILAMILANYIFLVKAFGGWAFGEKNEWNYNSSTPANRSSGLIYVMFMSNFISAAFVIIFYWNKVQSWRTGDYHKRRGMKARHMQGVNQARGPLSLVLQSIFPLVLTSCSESLLNDNVFSLAVATIMLGISIYIFLLIKDYAPQIFIFLAAPKFCLALAIIQYGSIGALTAAFPTILDFVELDAAYVISLCQHGFLGYYMYSRRLISEHNMTSQAKYYHRVYAYLLAIVYARRLYYGFGGVIPTSMQVYAYPYAIVLFGATAYSLSTWVPQWLSSVVVYGRTGAATSSKGSKKTK